MDKQLIERIVGEEIDAMEFEEAVTESYGKQRTQRIVERCVARIDAERGKKAVARIGDVWQIDWIGRGPIAPIIEAHGLKVGDFLYAAADIPIVTVQFDLNDWDSRDAFAGEMIAEEPQGERNE